MKFEKPQKGNPHGLTVMQHTFPRASIARFTGGDGRVSVSYMSKNKQLRLAPSDQLFCAKRTWDQRAEQGFMKKIEDSFQALAEAIIDGRVKRIGFFEKTVVDDFFALWNIREHRKSKPISDQAIKGVVALGQELTKDQQESLEKNYYGFVRPDYTVPGRQMAGLNIQMNLDAVRQQLVDSQWGILKAKEGEFIVPDNFSNARIVPVTPEMCLFSQSENGFISLTEVAKINRLAIASSREYFFARDFSKYPTLIL